MRRYVITILFLLLAISLRAQQLYMQSFGNAAAPALIFLHGGPGYNAAAFEATTPQRLADSGFFVIVYDRRGEGRSRDSAAKFNFREAVADLAGIYAHYGIKKASLLGHSFGGVIGTKFAEAHPEQVDALVLVAAPVELQASFRNIISRCRKIFIEKGDSAKLKFLASMTSMDTASLAYSSTCFGMAMQNGFYTPRSRDTAAKAIYEAFRADTALSKRAMQMDFRAPRGYWEAEHYTTIDLRSGLAALKRRGVKIFGIYGTEDGLYSPEQIDGLRKIIGQKQVFYLENASHNVFIDQQRAFIGILKTIVAKP